MDISKTGKNGAPGAPGSGTANGGKGGHGGKAVAQNNNITDTTNTAEAYGGSGGDGGDSMGIGGAGGAGGTAQSLACTSLPFAGLTSASAMSVGGAGGNGGADYDGRSYEAGGPGGNATATAIDVNMLGSASASAIAIAGNGGTGGSNGGGGAGGIAHGTTASAIGLSSATASVIQQGGDGGQGEVSGPQQGASGGVAGSSTLRDAVSGFTLGGRLSLSQTALGGNGGGAASVGAQQGGDAVSVLNFDDRRNPSASIALLGTVTAEGGIGGSLDDGSGAASGGSSNATIDLTGLRNVAATALAGALSKGVAQGGGDNSGNGGDGGQALAKAAASSMETQARDSVIATAHAIGGDGGGGSPVAQGGNGGAASARAAVFSDGAALATAAAFAMGGDGGYGFETTGGSGASVSLVNAVSGQTSGGSLKLVQSAIGGNGGDGGQGAGAAGDANSYLHFDDTAQSTKSASVSVSLTATGGNSGNPALNFLAENGGAADAEAVIMGAGAVNVAITATGGNVGGGLTNTFNNNMTVTGGNATAISTGRGSTVNSVAHAIGGAGPDAGVADAQSAGFGVSGTVLATAATSVTGTAAVLGVSATAAGIVAGNGGAEALAQIGVASPVLDMKTPSLAFISGAPLASDVSTVLSANGSLSSAYGSAANVLALSELGGTYASHPAMGNETSSTSCSVSLEASQLNPKDDIVLGLYGPDAHGQNLGSVSLAVSVNGANVLSAGFSTAAAANAYFTDHPLDLGSIASLSASGTIAVTVSVSETGSAPNSSMFGGALLGQGMVTGAWHQAQVSQEACFRQGLQDYESDRLLSLADPHFWHG